MKVSVTIDKIDITIEAESTPAPTQARREAPTAIITGSAIRECLLSRARAFVRAHGSSFSAISSASTGDSKFLHRVEKGENFSIKSFDRVMFWLASAQSEGPAA